MFLRAFWVFSCLVLYTASIPVLKGSMCKSGVDMLQNVIPKMQCNNSFIQQINFTRVNNLYATHQELFCQISKALNDSSCKETKISGELRRLSHQMQGNVTCTLLDNGVKTNMADFLDNLKKYLSSLTAICPKK